MQDDFFFLKFLLILLLIPPAIGLLILLLPLLLLILGVALCFYSFRCSLRQWSKNLWTSKPKARKDVRPANEDEIDVECTVLNTEPVNDEKDRQP